MKTKEILVNKCYGGYGLSPLAVKKVTERKGKECFFFKISFLGGGSSSYEPINIDECEGSILWVAFSANNPNELLGHCNNNWFSISEEERAKYNEDYNAIKLDYGRESSREDPDIVAVFKELGSEKFSGQYSKIEITEIPADVEYEIDEYDGMEHVQEVARKWY
jgi:hypothetical protein